MVARNINDEIMAVVTSYHVSALSPLLAEVMALAIDLGFKRVCFEADCLQLNQWWKRGVESRSYLTTIIRDSRSYVSTFDYVCIFLIDVKGNSVADFLAKNAST